VSADGLLARADVANRAGAHAFSCSDTAGFINRLIDINAAKPAKDLYQNSCATTAGLVQDPHLREYFQHQPVSHLSWYTPENSLILPTQNDPSGMSFYSDNDVLQPILAQRIVASPGLYRLTWDMPDTPDAFTKKLLVNLSCSREFTKARQGEATGQSSIRRTLQFRLDATCPIPELSFWLTAMNGTIKIDNVTLQKVAG
jgi:hypothetical protein